MVHRARTSCCFSWKRCWLVFSYHGKFSRFQVSKYIEYSAYTGCISLYIYCLITCNIKSLLNVPKISHISRKISQVSRFPAKSPDSRNKFVFLPKQPLLELSPPVRFNCINFSKKALIGLCIRRLTFVVQCTCILNSKLHKLLIQGLEGFINLLSLISIVILLA